MAEVFDDLERSDPEGLLLERLDEPFRDAVAFRRSHQRRTRRDSERSEFSLKIPTIY